MIRAIIVDDENLNIKSLQFDLNKFCPSIDVVATADNIDEAIELIIKLQPDVVFLDIQIHDATGFDLLNTLNIENLNVIIISAYEKYGIQAIKHSVIDYILKPVQHKELIAAVHKLEKKLTYTESTLQKNTSVAFIPVANKEDIELIKTEEIIYLEAKGNYTEIITRTKKHTSSKLLKEFEAILPQNNFIRVHNSYIVNIHYITKYIRTKNGSLLLNNKITVPLSAAKKKMVTELLGIKS